MSSPSSVKRTAETAGLEELPVCGGRGDSSNALTSSFPIANEIGSTPASSRSSSPLSPVQGLSSRENSAQPPSTQNTPSTSNPPKRRKLTSAEKEVRRIEKQYKEQQKMEEKVRKEEERRAKEEARRIKEEETKEEKRRKEEEKKQKRKVKEAEKQIKHEEKRKKEEEKKAKEDEKAKKEKSQLKLGSFFSKPVAPSGGSILQDRSGPSSRRSSVTSLDGLGSQGSSRAGSARPVGPVFCDYDRAFPAFFIHAYTTVAPLNRFYPNEGELERTISLVDKIFCSDSDKIEGTSTIPDFKRESIKELLRLPPLKRRIRTPPILSVKNLISQIHSSPNHPIDLTDPPANTRANPLDALKEVAVKYLKYAEDVRPPYIGTYSKVPQGHSIAKLCRNPFTRALPATNYDYDSEAEWDEPEEGEDLDSEGEEEVDDEDGDDIREFLDDEGADDMGPNGLKRRHLMGDVLPLYTDIHWEGSQRHIGPLMVPYGQASLDLKSFKIRNIHDSPWPLDPYSTSYWYSASDAQADETSRNLSASSIMPPPIRAPLHAIQGTNAILPVGTAFADKCSKVSALSPHNGTTSKSKSSAPSKPMPPEILGDFKKAIDGSDLTKAGLLEVLKKKFPQVTKGTIQDTVAQVAHRVGQKEAEKRWCLT